MLKTTEITQHEIDNMYEQIAKNVKYYREKKGASQMELAQAIGYKSSAAISKPEKGIQKNHFNIAQLLKIADVLEIDILALLEGIKE